MLHKQAREMKVNLVLRHPRRLKNHGEENTKKTRQTQRSNINKSASVTGNVACDRNGKIHMTEVFVSGGGGEIS